MIKIEVSKENERYLREMLSKNSLYGTMQDIVDRAITNFYQLEKKRRFISLGLSNFITYCKFKHTLLWPISGSLS